MKKTHFMILGRRGFLTSPGQSVQILLKSTITLAILLLLTFGPQTTFAQNIPSKVLRGHTGSVTGVVFNPDGSRLASGSSDKTIGLWDGVSGAHIATLRHTGSVTGVVFSPDGSRLASGSQDGDVRLWDGVSGDPIATLRGHTSSVNSVVFSPDGSRLASGSYDNTVRLWDGVSGDPIATLRGHTSSVNSVVFSPDGSRLASGSSDNTVRLWEGVSGDLMARLEGHTRGVSDVVFSPDGSRLASGSWDATIRLWDGVSGDPIATLEGHTPSVNGVVYSVSSVVFSPDGSRLASASADRTIRLWDGVSGDPIATLEGHTGSVNNVVFSPDGSRLASSSADRTIRLWELWELPDTRISITPLPVDDPAIGEKLTLKIDITGGKNIKGYQAKIIFDDTALRYVESANGNFLPADAFFVPPVVEGNQVTLGATSVADDSSGDGTLAILTFEVIAIKESTLTLSEIVIVNSTGDRLGFYFGNRKSVVGVPRLREDVNLDGVVDILDLQLVASGFGKPRQTIILRDTVVVSGDVNGDGDVDIVDLVLVAGALGNKAAAPSVYAQTGRLFTAADVKLWLSQAQHLNLIDAQSQRGILFLQQLLAAFTPKKTALLPNYPNPFNPETWIPYQLAESADVTLTIYAIDGTVVRTLALGHQSPGLYQNRSRAAHWDGKNNLGESVASGVYFYTLTAGNFTATRKMLIRK